jgi:membrane protein implicated in regulation of membrane protease activity
MSQPTRRRHGPIIWAAITILLLAALVGTLWVPFYARSTPKLGDFPFFYWYQLIWVPIVAILSWLAYLLINSGRPRRGHRRPPGPDGQPGMTP